MNTEEAIFLGTVNMSDRYWHFIDLGVTKYSDTHALQQQIVSEIIAGETRENIVLLVEHFPVFTLGNQGGKNNLKVSELFLEKHDIDLVKTKRGGDITYHGPGQLVLYPILSLAKERLSVPEYIWLLEEVMIKAVGQFDVQATRNPQNRGIWINNKKLGSIGISIRRGITFHGLALNVATNLSPYSWINPCGLNGVQVTSLEKELSGKVNQSLAKDALLISMQKVFQCKMKPEQDHNCGEQYSCYAHATN